MKTNRIMLIAVVAALMLWLSGCMVIDSEEHCRTRQVRVIHAPPVRTVEVVHVPGPPARPHGPRDHAREWR
jgi:hypothetical protein